MFWHYIFHALLQNREDATWPMGSSWGFTKFGPAPMPASSTPAKWLTPRFGSTLPSKFFLVSRYVNMQWMHLCVKNRNSNIRSKVFLFSSTVVSWRAPSVPATFVLLIRSSLTRPVVRGTVATKPTAPGYNIKRLPQHPQWEFRSTTLPKTYLIITHLVNKYQYIYISIHIECRWNKYSYASMKYHNFVDCLILSVYMYQC